MATMEEISAALKLTGVKKSNLRKAFEDLNALSSSLSSFTLAWSDIEDHFTSIQSLLDQKFKQLQTQLVNVPSQPSATEASRSSAPSAKPSSPRPELQAFCASMDGLGLRNYLQERPKERQTIRVEIPGALRCSPDPAAMILDALKGFYEPGSKGDKDASLVALRRNCILLLEELMRMKPEISPEVKEKARKLAGEWREKASTGGDNPLEALGFLHLLAAYRMASEFGAEELLDFLVIIGRYREAVQLCQALIPVDKIPDLIQKLIAKSKQLLAVKFICEFKLTDKFPPVPLLRAYVVEAKKLAKKVRKDGNNSLQSLNEATAKEVSALRQVIKYIEDHKLESEYPKGDLEKRIEQLEKHKAERKRPAAAVALKQQQQSKLSKQSGSKRRRMTAPAGPLALSRNISGANSTLSPFQHSHLQPEGLLPDRPAPAPAPYLTSSAGPYGLAGSAAVASQYAGSSAGLYGLAGSSLVLPDTAPTAVPHAGPSSGLYGLAGSSKDFPGNLSPTRSRLYSTDSHLSSGYYDRLTAYGGYGLPPRYHPSYYPQ